MSHPTRRAAFISLTLTFFAGAWLGCATSGVEPSTTGSSSSTGQGGTSGTSSGTGAGGIAVDKDGGLVDDGGACTSTSAEAHPVPLDLIFLIDQSGSMAGPKWTGTTAALKSFFNDPASAKIGVGLSFFPNLKPFGMTCVPEDYKILDVPINTLPANAFPLTNSLPEVPGDPVQGPPNTPTYGALKGVLMAATAFQDAHPTHKVGVVLATDGEPNACGATTNADVAALAKNARNYNGVSTYVIGVEGSNILNLNNVAAAGGTGAAYDITNDISAFSETIAKIRAVALGCEFEIPDPPGGNDLDPDRVNFTYTPNGQGMPKVLLRADDILDCKDDPGWYYDSNLAPTKIILCPASCSTVQADSNAAVSVLFGCKSQVN
jgi:hypothetical protein